MITAELHLEYKSKDVIWDWERLMVVYNYLLYSITTDSYKNKDYLDVRHCTNHSFTSPTIEL